MRALCCALAASYLLATGSAGSDPFAFFRPSVVLGPKEARLLERGGPVVSILDAGDRDLAVFTAIELDAGITPDRVSAWMHNIEELRKSAYVLGIKRFSTPPRLEDLETLLLDEDDLSDIQRCRPGRCGLKLTGDEIAEMRAVIARAGVAWKPAVQSAFRQLVLQRVLGYAANGHAALGEYHDRKRPRSPAAAFLDLLRRSAFLRVKAPAIADALSGAAAAPPGAEDFLYWSKERMGGKAVVSATHVRIFRGNGPLAPEVLMAGKQVFATHYLDACLGVTALVRDRRASRAYLVYVNRSDIDLLAGVWGSFARRAIEGRVEADAPAILREVGQRLSGGDPPPLTGMNVR